ncbi:MULTISPECIES: GatB/YqeY domain-containing protein [Mycobacteriaceae]|uniref:hypothetical protein n=1 Tax=Mycobacteriaceae TaxID=1762 RepID=UPI00036ACC84|nr:MULTISPECIES: hypothetical protein [Mycobacteriaceae]AHC25746.2 hypothetical protein D174_14630 [Mycolicibacterium neoaurum VKM Ac-1815D]AMO06173.1 hypothetical protein MyAD_14370 [Mycolicibacterium neoaurum]AXK75484.1 hypothetical protein DXK33_10615 [Mycolicibacterium neoaurum]KJQ50328.1 hypothetical protein TS71_10065 [Mycolicibacterium neoaurum]KUM09490.1 hypothetical protein AVZ31_04590 [Mycolicibacterium neoaurum]
MVDDTHAATALRDAMRADLSTAMKARAAETVAALRAGLAAIDNAEAVDIPDRTGALIPPGPESVIAGATTGLGSSEVSRRDLSSADVRAVISDLMAEYVTEADRYGALNRPEAAEQLRRQAAALSKYVGA